jgi:hypothetical protein
MFISTPWEPVIVFFVCIMIFVCAALVPRVGLVVSVFSVAYISVGGGDDGQGDAVAAPGGGCGGGGLLLAPSTCNHSDVNTGHRFSEAKQAISIMSRCTRRCCGCGAGCSGWEGRRLGLCSCCIEQITVDCGGQFRSEIFLLHLGKVLTEPLAQQGRLPLGHDVCAGLFQHQVFI